MDTVPPSTDPSLAEVSAELARVLASADFVASDQLSRFLRYVVEETLEGRGDRIKELTVATGALRREADFDPRMDPIVRVVAGKLRRALMHYYTHEGAANPLRIEIPKGTYRPVFDGQVAQGSPPEQRAAASGYIAPANATPQPGPVQNRHRPHPDRRSRAIAAFGVIALLATTILVAGPFLDGGDAEPPVEPQDPADPVDLVEQTGALPCRVRDGVMEVLLVRTLRNSHWTIPKATQDPGTAVLRTASQEAFQEAGVHGAARPSAIGSYLYERKGKRYRVTVYPVLVAEEVSTWPEMARTRRWCDIESAASLVASDELAAVIRNFDQ